jgi:serine/threonine-protein kinase
MLKADVSMFGFIKSMINGWRDYPHREHTLIQNRYLIQKFIGQGSFGTTYCCVDRHQSDCLVLVKQSRASKGRRAVELLNSERRVLEVLVSDGIPSFYDYFEWNGAHYIVTQFVFGENVESMIFDQRQVIDDQQCIEYALQLLRLLAHVHSNGFVHLDVRLPNVIVNQNELYLVDFGLVRNIGDHPDEEPYAEGKLPYRHLAEPQSDLNAVGHMMLYMLYSGFDNHYVNDADHELGWQEELVMTKELRLVLRKLLKIDTPYETAEEVIGDLLKLKETKKPVYMDRL